MAEDIDFYGLEVRQTGVAAGSQQEEQRMGIICRAGDGGDWRG
jgi:hypothetical protein